MLTLAQIEAAVSAELGDTATLLPTGAVERWFNEGQSRLQWHKHAVLDVSWAEGDLSATLSPTPVQVVEILYAEDGLERRWRPVVGGLVIEDYAGAQYAEDAKVIVQANWPEVSSTQDSELPRVGDAACIAYVLHRFFRRLTADRSVFQRYATLMGENGVSIDDLGDLADDHYRDFLDLRGDLPSEPPAVFYPEG